RSHVSIGTTPDLPRVFLVDETGQWLIQIQRDRFLHNWRVSRDGERYPRFPAVRQRFFDQWSRFEEFVAKNSLGAIEINQLEITYLNQIPLVSAKLFDAFPDLQWRSDHKLAHPESMEASYTFRQPDVPKRLRATIKPTINEGRHEI